MDQLEKRFARRGVESLFSNSAWTKAVSVPSTFHRTDFQNIQGIHVLNSVSGGKEIGGSLLPDRRLRDFRYQHFDSTRLRVELGEDGKIQNALGVLIVEIYYRDKNGTLWEGEALQSGQSSLLTTRTELPRHIKKKLSQNMEGKENLPKGVYYAKLRSSPFNIDMGYQLRTSLNEVWIMGVIE